MPGMSLELYREICTEMKNFKGSARECNFYLCEKFPDVPNLSLGSIYSLEYQRRMKQNHARISSAAAKYYDRFQEAVNRGDEPGIILRIAQEVDISPALLARMILEQHYERLAPELAISVSKALISRKMKDTTLIEDRDVAYEVYLSTLHDDQYGPLADVGKHSLGQEFELKLQRIAKDLKLAFRGEEHLRLKGFDKTPDLKLDIPIAVDGFIVNWIESKALFGDEEGHRGYLKDQYLSYWNRFGTGLVIYWLGYLETLDQMNEKKIIIMSDFPSNITKMNPHCIKPPQL
ncbi:CDAN1-interacting nuclease 1 [Frankliniella occidentalis]|uniref:CDAN1-interacting nuclease 1 n=1 Tax=Frankliniella occidentalis TaxID=133901 RepID=A0A6J1T1B6_FRAOC|nr:CDAN1-interacting nuclease 1 [Frankliniella occidentalis]